MMMTACQSEDYETTATGEPLELTVTASDFTLADGTTTRATDNGTATTFENGDLVGLIIVDKDGNLLADNAPYKLNGSTWSFDTSSGKQPACCDPAMSISIVYYPYDAAANGAKSVEDLKDKFPVLSDQSTKDNYRKSDLMTWTGTAQKKITATLSHARASFSLAQPKVELNSAAVGNAPELSNILLYDKEGNALSTYRANDKTFRRILPEGYNGTVRWAYSYLDGWYGGERTVGGNTGTRYAQTDKLEIMNVPGHIEPTVLKPGDYIYQDGTISDGGLRMITSDGYMFSQDVSPESSKTCVGIIFHVRGDGSPADNCTYGEFTGKPTGYIVSLDENKSKWSDNAPGKNDGTPNGEINGYKYTAQYAGYYGEGGSRGSKGLVAIPWCTNHTAVTESTAAKFSTWFMPHMQEYRLMRGEMNGKTPILDILEKNLVKAGGTAFQNDHYFTCGLMGSYGNYLHMLNLRTGQNEQTIGDGNHTSREHPYRAVCAFQLK